MRLYLEELKAIERGDHAEAQRLREERRELRRRRRKMKAMRKGG
jgi:FtsZ-binding cell division protein ZapB